MERNDRAVGHEWKVRVRGIPLAGSRAYTRNHTFSIGAQAGFRESDGSPSAVELLLGALGGDLIEGWRQAAGRAGLPLADVEVDLAGRLDNPLRHLGVAGEQGHSGVSTIRGTIYLGADISPEELRRLWAEVLDRAPVHATLSRCVEIVIEPRLVF